MTTNEWSHYTDRLMNYATFTGGVEGVIEGLEKGWITQEAACKRIREVLAELQAKNHLPTDSESETV